ncbi:MAG: hypothetical protein H0V93_08340, partial [Euzebyales bacterium]|nr:hypothetical protein [Euzebyales bacterium]
MTPALAALVTRARRRMRRHRVVAAGAPALAAAGGLGLAWSVASRLVLLPDLDALVTALLLGAVAVAAALAALVRIPAVWAAMAADRWLGTRDQFATAAELSAGALSGVGARQVADAEEAAGRVG